MVGVLGVRIVRRDEEAAREHHLEVLLVLAKAKSDAAQRIAQEGRTRALLGRRADLFIIENAADSDVPALLCRKEAGKAAAGALQIVELGREDIFLVLAEQRPFAAAVEEEVAAENVALCNACSLGDDGQDTAAFLPAEQRQRIDIRHVLHAVVHRAVHVDSNIGDHKKIAVNVHELFRDPAVFAHEDTPRDGERTVEPRRHQHTAVFFGGELDIVRAAAVGVLLEAEGRRIGMRRRHRKSARERFRHAEGNGARAVAADKILSARLHVPLLALGKLMVALRKKFLPNVLGHMIAGGAIFNEVQQFLCRHTAHSIFLRICNLIL